jgi:integrase
MIVETLPPFCLPTCPTGFRAGELKSLRWRNVDLANGSMTVESAYSKNGETRTVPLTDDLAKTLQADKDDRKPESDDPVFTNNGKVWTCWKEAFTGAVERAGLKDFRFTIFAIASVRGWAMNNVPDKGRMELMGHKDPKMTMRYTHLSMAHKRAAVQKLPCFGTASTEAESQQISQQMEASKVVAFGK